MDDLFHRWLLVYLYHFATCLLNYAKRLQVTIRHALLNYASRAYNPKQPLRKTVIPWQQRLAEAEKGGKPISPIRHRKELSAWLHCPNCGAPKEYLYNFGYEHGHSGDEAFHKIRYKICGFQTAPDREKHAPHFFCPYCLNALVKTKERRDFDVLKCRNKQCPYRHDVRLRLEAIRNGASPKAKAYIYRSFRLELTELQLKRPEKPKLDFARLRHSTTAVALALTFHIHLGFNFGKQLSGLTSYFVYPFHIRQLLCGVKALLILSRRWFRSI